MILIQNAAFVKIVFLLCINISIGELTAISAEVMLSTLQGDVGRFVCPGTDFCETNRTELERRRMEMEEGNCCADCSCDEGCGLNNDCCFKEKKGRADETCVLTEPFVFRSPAYLMVSSCEQSSSSGVTKQCSDFNDTALWGSLYPVYFEATNSIFMNARCAECNGVDVSNGELTPFEATFECYSPMYAFQSLIGEILEDINTKALEKCNIRFTVPRQKIYKISKKRCFNPIKIKDSCSPLRLINWSKDTINENNITFNMVEHLCKSSFFSPYISKEGLVYKNVFCSLCSGNDFKDGASYCQKMFEYTTTSKTSPFPVFTLLANAFASNIKTKKVSTKTSLSACLYSNGSMKADCRQVYCPTGRTFSVDQKCSFLRGSISGNGLSLFLKLTLKEPIIRPLTLSTNQNLSEHIVIPLLKAWQILSVYHSIVQIPDSSVENTQTFQRSSFTSVEIEHLAVHLKYNNNNGDFNDDIILEFQSVLDSDIAISIGNISRLCTAKVLPGDISRIGYNIMYDLEHGHWVNVFNNAGELGAVSLVETFFCYLLEFCGTEVDSVDPDRAYIKAIDKYFETDQIVKINRQSTKCFRICIHHTPFKMLQNKQPTIQSVSRTVLGISIVFAMTTVT